MLLACLLGRRLEGAVHGPDARDEGDAHDEPRVGAHDAEARACPVQGICRCCSDAEAGADVAEGLVEERGLEGRQRAARLAVVEEGKRACASEDGGAANVSRREHEHGVGSDALTWR